jgi:hypothetical protein
MDGCKNSFTSFIILSSIKAKIYENQILIQEATKKTKKNIRINLVIKYQKKWLASKLTGI